LFVRAQEFERVAVNMNRVGELGAVLQFEQVGAAAFEQRQRWRQPRMVAIRPGGANVRLFMDRLKDRICGPGVAGTPWT
jgi:hypothetical protein